MMVMKPADESTGWFSAPAAFSVPQYIHFTSYRQYVVMPFISDIYTTRNTADVQHPRAFIDHTDTFLIRFRGRAILRTEAQMDKCRDPDSTEFRSGVFP